MTRPVAIGEEWVQLWWLHNVSNSPLSLVSASVEGHPWGASSVGVGTVVESVGFNVGPVGAAGGSYSVYPPALLDGKRCRVFEPHPVAGYAMAPDEDAMILIHLRSLRPGRFETLGVAVSYTQDGATFTEVIPFKLSGKVASNGEELEPDPEDLECLPKGGRVLP